MWPGWPALAADGHSRCRRQPQGLPSRHARRDLDLRAVSDDRLLQQPGSQCDSFSPDGWFATGDIGILDENGYLKIVDRKKELIIRGGANIYPREIEEVLYQHPKVLEAAAVGVPDQRLGERVCACIVPRPGESVSLEELVAFLRDKIATYKLPEFLQLLDALPRTPTGKVQKGPLRDIVLQRMAPPASEQPM